jgi:hypothetical protein
MKDADTTTTASLASSLAIFGAVAVGMTVYKRMESSSEDLDRSTYSFAEEEEDLELFAQSVPKIELHVHLDGSFDPHQLWLYLMKNPHLLTCLPVQKVLPWSKDNDDPLLIR